MKRFISSLVGLFLLVSGSTLVASTTQGVTTFDGIQLTPKTFEGMTYSFEAQNTSGTRMFSITPAGAVYIGGAITLGSTITFGNGESIDNTTDDYIEFQGGSGADDTDLRIDLDGTYPILDSPTDTAIGINEALVVTSANGVNFATNLEKITSGADDMIDFTGVSGADDTDLRLDLDGTHPVLSSATDTAIQIAEDLLLASGDKISNAAADTVKIECAGACADSTDIAFDVDGTHPVISSATDATIEIAEALVCSAAGGVDVQGASGIILENDETITNSVNGAVLVTASWLQSSGGIEAQGGAVYLESGDLIDNAAADVVAIQCAGACADASDIAFDVDGTYPILYSATDTTVGINDVLALESGDTISNATPDTFVFQCVGACAAATDLTIDVDDATGPVLSSTTSGAIQVAEGLYVSGAAGLDVSGGNVLLQSDETISNSADDVVSITGVGGTNDVALDIDLDATGIGGAVEISSSTSTQITILENLGLASGDLITNAAADTIKLECGGACADATDLSVDVDGTHPVISSATDATVEIAEALIVSAAGGIDVQGASGVILENDETITNAVNGEVLVTATAFQASGSIEAQGGDVILESGDVIDNVAADVVGIYCAGACADPSDLSVDVDGTHPVIYSATDGVVEVSDSLTASGGMTLTCTGCLTATNVADVTRTIQTPLTAWRIDADPHTDIAAGTTPNVSAEGNFDTIEWATGEAQKITYTFKVPADYSADMTLRAMVANDAAAANNAETLSVSWYNAKDGEADNPAAVDEGAIAITNAETLDEESAALDGGTVEAGDLIRLVVGFTAIDQTMHIAGLWLTYTATQ